MPTILQKLRCLLVHAFAFTSAVFLFFALIPLSVISRSAGRSLILSWQRLLTRLHGIRLVVSDANAGRYSGGCVFVQLNQASILDALIVLTTIPVPHRAVINIEFALLPFWGWSAWLVGHFIIIRQRHQQAMRVMQAATQELKRGGSIVISIEGRRSVDGSLGPYKKGPIVAALASGASIVPYVVRGTFAALPHGQWFIRPGVVELRYLPAISTAGLGYADRDALLAELRRIATTELEVP